MAVIKHENIWKLLNTYDFEIDSNLIVDLTCTICHKIIKDCRQSLCGCRYCAKCIKNYLNETEMQCPGSTRDCNKYTINLNTIQIDHVANIKLSRIVVKCPESGCQHRDELTNIEEHMNSHLDIQCPYFEIGCDKPGLNNFNINDHLKNNEFSHSTLLMNSLQQMKNEMISFDGDSRRKTACIELILNEIEDLRQNNDDQSEIIHQLESEILNLNTELNTVKRNYKEKEKLITKLSQQIDTSNAEMRAKFEELKAIIEKYQSNREIENPYVSLPNLAQPLQSIFSNQKNIAPFKWEITRFSEKRQYAQEYLGHYHVSEPFYSHQGGYKLYLTVWPNGCSTYNKNQLSVGFHIMQGHYDNQLSWPMMHTVTISLIDQKSNTVFHFVKFHYDSTPAESKSRFLKPISGSNKTLRSPNFMNLNELLTNPRLYCNDSIILICSID